MIRLLLLLALIAVLAQLVRWLRNQPPAQRRGAILKAAVAIAAVALILLAATGRIHWVGAALGALLALGQRLLPMLIPYVPALGRWFKNRQGGSGSGQSSVRTATLDMQLDHASQHINGRVLAGPFAGRELDALDQSELQQLLDYVREHDSESEKLLYSYLQHRFGEDWQHGSGGDTRSRTAGNGAMSRDEALKILGLDESAGRDDIVLAHRRLMQKFHPDRGGNDYLAARINQAKELLLG